MTRALKLTEKQFQQRIVDLCRVLGLKCYHTYDSRKSVPGFPDLVIVGPNRLIFAELKSSTGVVSAAQQDWIDSLIAAGQDAYIWQPEDWPVIESMLKVLAGRTI